LNLKLFDHDVTVLKRARWAAEAAEAAIGVGPLDSGSGADWAPVRRGVPRRVVDGSATGEPSNKAWGSMADSGGCETVGLGQATWASTRAHARVSARTQKKIPH